ncbi:MAG: helix-turn-helix domain-containing protein [Oscillospiraceae bacterium]|nr:helix-turn-helix domain-containing protein [Oscillospiraceae bacterium]
MVAQRLRELRKQHTLTQQAAADGLGMLVQQYQAYEFGRKTPSCPTLIALADFFDVSIDYLVGRTDNPSVNI